MPAGDGGTSFTESDSTLAMYADAQREIQLGCDHHRVIGEVLPHQETTNLSQTPIYPTSWLTDRSSYGSSISGTLSLDGRLQLSAHHSPTSISQQSSFAESPTHLARLNTNTSTKSDQFFSMHDAADSGSGGVHYDSIAMPQDGTRGLSSLKFQASCSPVIHSHGPYDPHMVIPLSPTLDPARLDKSNAASWQHTNTKFGQPDMTRRQSLADLNPNVNFAHYGELAADLSVGNTSFTTGFTISPTTIPSSSDAPPTTPSDVQCTPLHAQVGHVWHGESLPLNTASDPMYAFDGRIFNINSSAGPSEPESSKSRYPNDPNCLLGEPRTCGLTKGYHLPGMPMSYTPPSQTEERELDDQIE